MESRRGMKNGAVLGQVLRPQLLAAQPARALSSSDSLTLEVERLGLGMEADHHRGGKRPGLRGTVDDVLHPHLDLLVDLARHGILEALARLDEARQRRMHAARKMLAAAQQALVAVMDQHDDRRIGAREMLGLAALVGAHADVAAARDSWCWRRTRRSSGGGGASRSCRGHRPGSSPRARTAAAPTWRRSTNSPRSAERRVLAGDVDGEIGRAVDIAQEDLGVGGTGDGAGHHALQEHRLGIAAGLDQVLLGVDRHEARLARRGELDHALLVLALVAGAVDFGAGIGISGALLHGARRCHSALGACAATSPAPAGVRRLARAPAPAPHVPPVGPCRRRSGAGTTCRRPRSACRRRPCAPPAAATARPWRSRCRSARPRSRSCRPCRSSSTRSVLTGEIGHQRQRLLHRAHRAERLLVAVAVQQRALLRQRLQLELEPAGLLLAHQEFLEQEGVVGDRLRLLAQPHGEKLVAQGEQARRLEADDRHALGDERRSAREQPLGLVARLVDLAGREIGAPTAQRPRADGRPGDGDPMAGRLEHAPRGMQDLGLEIVGEGVGEDHHRGVARIDVGGGEERVAAPLRQGALLGEAEVGLHEPGEVEQPGQAARPRRHGRQVADHPVAQAEALAHAPRRLHLDLHARHVDAGRAVALAALAAHAEIHRRGHGVGGERVGAELARQGEAQRVGAAARQVLLVARHAEGGTHGAGVELPAMAVVVAHLGGLGEAAGRIAAAARRGRVSVIGSFWTFHADQSSAGL